MAEVMRLPGGFRFDLSLGFAGIDGRTVQGMG
jgi:hypothetical protein